jgi:hypothetical protein
LSTMADVALWPRMVPFPTTVVLVAVGVGVGVGVVVAAAAEVGRCCETGNGSHWQLRVAASDRTGVVAPFVVIEYRDTGHQRLTTSQSSFWAEMMKYDGREYAEINKMECGRVYA